MPAAASILDSRSSLVSSEANILTSSDFTLEGNDHTQSLLLNSIMAPQYGRSSTNGSWSYDDSMPTSMLAHYLSFLVRIYCYDFS